MRVKRLIFKNSNLQKKILLSLYVNIINKKKIHELKIIIIIKINVNIDEKSELFIDDQIFIVY